MVATMSDFMRGIQIGLVTIMGLLTAHGSALCSHQERHQTSHPYDLTVVGSVNIYGGLGKQSIELIQALENDLSISFIPIGTMTSYDQASPSVQKILRTSGLSTPGKVLIFEEYLFNIPPGGLFEKYGLPAKDDQQLRFIYAMAETSRISKARAQLLNLFDAVLVPDPFLVEAFVKSGVTVPIFVLPLGLFMDDFRDRVVSPRTNPQPFVFGNFGYLEHRKNQVLLIQAFAQAFGNNPNVRLWLVPRGQYQAYRQQVDATIQSLGLTNIVVECRCDSRQKYLQRFQNIDCYVNVSRGEGFSIQPREAMVMGIPVIVSDNTAQHTICQSGYVRGVPSDIAERYVCPEFGHQYLCTVDDVAAALRDVYAHPNQYRSPQARTWALQYDFANLRSDYRSILAPKRIVMSSTNKITPRSVYTSSNALMKKMRAIFPNASVHTGKKHAR